MLHYFFLGSCNRLREFSHYNAEILGRVDKIVPSVGCIGSYILRYFFFGKAITKIHLGIAYATWCGIGIVATTLISYFIFKEKLSLQIVIGILCIAVGCIILNLKAE